MSKKGDQSNLSITLSRLPDAPGIYLFYNHLHELVYVGKATSLKNRVRSYFVARASSRPVEAMIHEIKTIDFKKTQSVLEAIILEALFIKKHQPKYNILGKDNKSWNYLALTREDFPTLVSVREHDILRDSAASIKKNFLEIFGPFPGLNTPAVMKVLRRLFHFSTCQKNIKSRKNIEPRACLYYEMGECLGVCVGKITKKDYLSSVTRPLKMFLSGRRRSSLLSLEKEMKLSVKREDFERAAALRDSLIGLRKIQDITLISRDFFADEIAADGRSLIRRIEGYDISNLGSTGIVGAMAVFVSGVAEKSQYRKFKIRTLKKQSDVDALEEVLVRRFAHPEWPIPDLILIDGGAPQTNRARAVLAKIGVGVPVVGIAKGRERKRNDLFPPPERLDLAEWLLKNKKIVINLRDESHRFAIAYQRSLRKLKI